MNQALRAHKLFTADVDYIVKEGKVIIIDEFTGRMMEGRRYSDGLHQALEAKEGVPIQNENQTLASITFQNYFRIYPKLSGMTGTAATEAAEFTDIYSLEVTEVPTNEPMIRDDGDDEVYRTADEKTRAIQGLIEECRARGQPVLVGTVSIEKSEHLAKMLKKKKIPHNVLNARYHDQEATIIAQAGRVGSVTIATNMAGRGTDIQLGGNAEMRVMTEIDENADERVRAQKSAEIEAEVAAEKAKVIAAGGLFILGTERHESRRIDNQLRGRSGRQGDPGASKFYLSLEDDLMRIFGSERMDGMLRKLGLKEDEAIIHPWINRALEKAQQKVEARNFEIRKNLLKFDDVMNDQRKNIYAQRIDLMEATDVSDTITGMRSDTIEELVARHIPEKAYSEQWDAAGLKTDVLRVFGLDLPVVDWAKEEGIANEEIEDRVRDAAERKMAEKASNYTPEVMRIVEKSPPPAAVGPALEGPPLAARPPALGHRAARLRPTRSAERVQERGLRHVPGALGRSTRGGDHGARPHRAQARSAAGELDGAAARARDAGEPRRPADRRGQGGAAATRRPRRARPEAAGEPWRSRDLGQGTAQRPLPVRLGQEIQTLPRQALDAVRGADRKPASIAGPIVNIDGAQTLHHRAPGPLDLAVLVSDDPQSAAKLLEQLAFAQQVRRIARPTITLIAAGEGFVDQHPARRQATHQLREQRPVEVIGHDDAGELAPLQRPRRAVLEIRRDCAEARLGAQIGDAREVLVERPHRVPEAQEKARVPAAPAGHVEHLAAGTNERGETAHPRAGRSWRVVRIWLGRGDLIAGPLGSVSV